MHTLQPWKGGENNSNISWAATHHQELHGIDREAFEFEW